MPATVRCEFTGAVATVTLAAPERRNTLSRQLLADLHLALDEALVPSTRVVVLAHEPPAFCAGADLKERLEGPQDSAPMADAMRRLQLADQPIIAAVKGPVRAGGIGLMAACDLVVLADHVDLAFTEVRIGVAPAIIAVPVLRKVRSSRLAAALLTGEPFDAQTALGFGLVSHVVPADSVDEQVERLVAGVLMGAPGAVAATKRLMRAVPGDDLDADYSQMRALSDELFAAAEGREGMTAFFEKRRPGWQPPA